MRDLVEQSGLPKTTIHHYIREDLLPPARKTAPNAARYGAEHLERLVLIDRLRNEEGLSIPEIRDVLGQVQAGTPVTAAIRLVRANVAADPAPNAMEGGPRWPTATALASAAGGEAELVRDLDEEGLLAGEADGFGAGDLLVVRACVVLCDRLGVTPSDLAPLADLLREAGNYSHALVELHAPAPASGGEAAAGRETAAGEMAGQRVKDLRGALGSLLEALVWRSFPT